MTLLNGLQWIVANMLGRRVTSGFMLVWFVIYSTTPSQADPTLARLSFWVPPERMDEFESAYQKHAVPILQSHGLVPYLEPTRATVDSVFARTFVFKTPVEFVEKRARILSDQTFEDMQRMLGVAFGTSDFRGFIRGDFEFYKSPVGPGQQMMKGSGRGHWQTYGIQDGLAYNRVWSIVQDRKGQLWFATEGGGISRYDGQRFTNFTTEDGLVHNTVRSIFEDNEGFLWFGTDGGVSRCDPLVLSAKRKSDDTLEDVSPFTNFTKEDGLAHNRVWSVFQDKKGIFWFGTEGGASCYDGQAFTTFTTQEGLANKSVRSIIQDDKGLLWFGTWGGVSCYDGETFTTFRVEDGLAENRVHSIYEDGKGMLWFCTRNGGVSRYDGETFTTLTTLDGLVSNYVRVMIEGRDGVFWFGTGGGVSRYDGKTFTSFNRKDGLRQNSVWSIFEDRDGVFWFGTGQGGVSRYNDQSFTAFSSLHGLASNTVYAVFQDNEGILWFGTHNGLSCYDGTNFTTFTVQDGLAFDTVSTIAQDRDGVLWFGHSKVGVTRYDGKTFSVFGTPDGLGHERMWSIIQDREGVLWFGTGNAGVSCYDGKKFTNFTTQDGLAYNTVRSIFQDREGVLWFGTSNGGVSRYSDGVFTTFTTEDGLVGNRVWAIFQDSNGLLWFGTGRGVSCYDGETFTTFTTKDGLAFNDVRSIFEDRDGVLWFGTNGGGVSRYDRKVFVNFTTEDGLVNNTARAISQDGEGSIWIGTYGGGVTRYRHVPATPPPVFIDAVLADRRYDAFSHISIPSGVALTMFEFHGISIKTRLGAMVYRYRLKGYEKDWKTTRARRVEYENLPVGHYTFEVEAVDRDLIYSQMPATVDVRVHLPYERLGWMLALGFAAVLVAWQTVRVIRRDRRLFAINEDLEIKSAEADAANEAKSTFLASMSHEIRTPLNAILGYAQLMEADPSMSLQHRQSMQAIHTSGGHLLDLINGVLDLSKIESGQEELQKEDFDLPSMVLRLGEMFQLSYKQKGLTWTITVPPSPLIVHGDLGKLRQVLVNLLGNAVKFTDEGSVALQVEMGPAGRFDFEVFDTGPGILQERQDAIFEPFQQEVAGHRKGGTGLGLAIAKRYVALMGGQLTVVSLPGVETRFTFALHLPLVSSNTLSNNVSDMGKVISLANGYQVNALVVDDVAENRDVLMQMLQRIGVRVLEAESGTLALKQMAETVPDIVFMDISMPGLSGEETLHQILEIYGQDRLKVVAVSAQALNHEQEAYLEAGFDDFIDKPIRLERLYACLANLLDVRFDYELDVVDRGLVDVGETILPDAIYNALKDAAERRNVSRLNICLNEAEALGVKEKQLVAPLRKLSLQYDMQAIIEALKEMRHG